MGPARPKKESECAWLHPASGSGRPVGGSGSTPPPLGGLKRRLNWPFSNLEKYFTGGKMSPVGEAEAEDAYLPGGWTSGGCPERDPLSTWRMETTR